MSVFELNNFRPDGLTNNIKPSNIITAKSPIVEIFSAMTRGMDTNKYGEKGNKVQAYLKALGEKAQAGNGEAKVELNTITTFAIQAPLLQRLQLFNFMGNLMSVGYNEEIRYRVYKIEGKMSNIQANHGDVTFPTASYVTRTMGTKTISGGMAVDYREVATGNFDNIGLLQEQVITDMYNKIFYDVELALYNGAKDATGIKHFAENAGVTKASVDDMIKAIRRWGRVAISGDYSVVSQLNSFVGFKADSTDTKATVISDAVMEEIRKTGLLTTYNGTPIIEIPNTYNLTKLNAAGTDYETYLPEGLLHFLVSGERSPLQIGYKGGLTSMSGTDITTGTEMARFDIEWGTVIVPEYLPTMGLISDSNYAVEK